MIIKSNLLKRISSCLLFLIAIYVCGLTLGYNPHDPSYYSFSVPKKDIMNYAGSWGALVGGFLFFQLGLCAYLTPFPLLFSIFAITVKKDKAWPTLGRYFVSSGFFMLGFGQIFAQFKPMISFRGLPFYTAGALGEQFYRFTKEFLGVWGQSIITLGCVLLGIILITQQSTTQTTKSPN